MKKIWKWVCYFILSFLMFVELNAIMHYSIHHQWADLLGGLVHCFMIIILFLLAKEEF